MTGPEKILQVGIRAMSFLRFRKFPKIKRLGFDALVTTFRSRRCDYCQLLLEIRPRSSVGLLLLSGFAIRLRDVVNEFESPVGGGAIGRERMIDVESLHSVFVR